MSEKPHLEDQIFTSAIELGDTALAKTNELLSIWGMTTLQYNALKVMYENDPEREGLPSKEIGKQLFTRVPDVTRLLERLVDKGCIIRERDSVNKRVVRSKLTEIGVELVESVKNPLKEFQSEKLHHLSDNEKATLVILLKKAKEGMLLK